MSPEFIDGYVAVIETLLLIVVPVLAILTAYSWWEARRLWKVDRYWLPIVIAMSITITGAAATWLVFTTLYRDKVGVVPLEFLPLNATSVLLLCVSPLLVPGYLLWLRQEP